MKKILLMLVLSVMLVGCSSNTEPVEKESTEEVEESSNISAELNSIERTNEDKWGELEEGRELILVGVTVVNNYEEEYQFNPKYIQMNVDGFIEMTSDKNPADQDSMRAKLMLHGEDYEGVVVFEVDEGQEYRSIVYDDFDNIIELD